MPQPDEEEDCEVQEAMAPSLAQYLLAAEQEDGTGTVLQDMSPAKKVRDGMTAHLDAASTPKGAK